MDKVERTFRAIQSFYKKNANPAIVKKYAKFFREGYDAYGIDSKTYSAQVDLWYQEIEPNYNLTDFKRLFTLLFVSNKYEEVSTATNFLSRLDKYYTKTLFKQIMTWVGKYYVNWGHIDIASNIVLSKFIINGVISHKDLFQYHDHKSKWVRRAVAVTTVYVFYRDKKLPPVCKAGDLLVNDPERKVAQGVGWMLRDAWKVYPTEIEKFLMKHVRAGNRTAYQYACEKMDKEYRKKFRRPK